ncbi:hypothetical protein HOY82DRAFT_539415 [Tuber indicum]|nr:hypothetical protein HOY82DRAFT_539415 [Tuber indicum]
MAQGSQRVRPIFGLTWVLLWTWTGPSFSGPAVDHSFLGWVRFRCVQPDCLTDTVNFSTLIFVAWGCFSGRIIAVTMGYNNLRQWNWEAPSAENRMVLENQLDQDILCEALRSYSISGLEPSFVQNHSKVQYMIIHSTYIKRSQLCEPDREDDAKSNDRDFQPAGGARRRMK